MANGVNRGADTPERQREQLNAAVAGLSEETGVEESAGEEQTEAMVSW